jgi:Ca-activated chloride channel family protein
LAHHLVSKYTSLVAVDKTPVRPAGDPLSKEQVPNLLPYGQSMNAIFGFPATATNATLLQLRGLAIIVVTLLLLGVGRTRWGWSHARASS